jgi:DNA topoisomerase-1
MSALNERYEKKAGSRKRGAGKKGRGSRVEGRGSKIKSQPAATWADLEPLIAELGLPADQAEVARRTQGQQGEVARIAKELNQGDEAVLKLFRQAMFKLRMEYGKRKGGKPEAGGGKPKAKKKASQGPSATWADLEPFLKVAKLPAQEAEVARRTQGQQKTIAQVAKDMSLPEEETLTLFRKAMFKIRMEYGRAKKELVKA